MRQKIIKKLQAIEVEHNIDILYACESGSRAWGFASKDSDHDIRFIYIRPQNWYLQLEKYRDVLELGVDKDLLDISGWDLDKTLRLMKKSNPSLSEWLISLTVYINKGDFLNEIKQLHRQYYTNKSSYHHYYATAKNHFKQYLQSEQVKTKKYFYVLRSLFSKMWIEKYKTQPPIKFQTLLDELTDNILKTEVKTLLQQKIRGHEVDYSDKNLIIDAFIRSELERDLNDFIAIKTNYNNLNAFFIEELKRNSNESLDLGDT